VTLAAKPSEAHLDKLRGRLASHGVPLFEPLLHRGATGSGAAALGELIADLAASGDPGLEGSIPCVVVAAGGEAARDATEQAARNRPELRERLGWLYRLARALATSRGFDLERLFDRPVVILPSSLEPSDLPAPSESFGEATVWQAKERSRVRGEPDDAGSVERLFDTWILLLRDARARERA
jgi:hypothetical protein